MSEESEESTETETILGAGVDADHAETTPQNGKGAENSGENTAGEQPNGEENQDSDQKESEPDPADTVPEGDYEFTMPEGVELNKELAEFATPILKEYNITQAQAQAMTEILVKQNQQQMENWQNTRAEWAESTKNHPEFGGEHFEANVKAANALIDKFGDDDFKELLQTSGAGNHPALFSFMTRLSKSISDDVPEGGEAASTQKSDADILYG